MNKFKVLVSQHSDEKGRAYAVGDVVTTTQDLDLQFGANKFERLGASAPAAKPAKSDPEPLKCPHCGAKFDKPMKFCGECGKSMTGEAA